MMEGGSRSTDPSLAPILHAIISKYGDIGKECSLKSTFLRTCILEVICKVVLELEGKTLDKLDENFLYICDLILDDAERIKFNGKWLRQRLDKLCDGVKAFLETKQRTNERTKLMEDIDYMKKNLQIPKAHLERLELIIEEREIELALKKLESERLSNKISGLATRYQHYMGKSLIDGLL